MGKVGVCTSVFVYVNVYVWEILVGSIKYSFSSYLDFFKCLVIECM